MIVIATHREAMSAPTIHKLTIERFRGFKSLSWRPAAGVNLLLGGGNVGKTTILEAIGLLLSPSGYNTLSDSDYHLRDVEAGFTVEGVMSLPPETEIANQFKTAWPWMWDGENPVVPAPDPEQEATGTPVYKLCVRGTSDLELIHEIVQPDETTIGFSVGLRRAIGLVRLSGDDRNDRDLRLVQGSALDRLLSDRGLRSRMAHELADNPIIEELSDDARGALESLKEVFESDSLPHELDIAVTGGQGFSIAALIGLTAEREGVPLPLVSWGAGTRRLAALAIARQTQANVPITLVDEVERGLEPYRQRFLMQRLQGAESQTFVTTHSPTAIAAATGAALWYVDHAGRIGSLKSPEVTRQQQMDPETFLARLTIVAEGRTEEGFASALLERALGSPLEQPGVHVADGGGHESSLNLLQALAGGGLSFGGFADDEGKYGTRWARIADQVGPLLFRWSSGSTEDHVIELVPDDQLEALLTDPDDEKTGLRLRTLQERLNTPDKDFETLKTAAGSGLKAVIIEAAKGDVPPDKDNEKKHYKGHGQAWFKSEEGGRELLTKVFDLGLWPELSPLLMPFCNGARAAVGLPPITDLPS